MKVGIIIFPGSNCDHDAEYTFREVLNLDTKLIWHKETSLQDVDMVFIPGGFSFGDYLRSGAIAGNSPIMKEVVRFAQKGNPVIGVCNGFQILTEVGLLPGALMKNKSLKFICDMASLKVENTNTLFTSQCEKDQILQIPIAHGEGNFEATHDMLEDIEANQQVVFRYSNLQGEVNEATNPNGSWHNIAGIVNKNGNVLGMMPHPERAVSNELGSDHGLIIFESLLNSVNA